MCYMSDSVAIVCIIAKNVHIITEDMGLYDMLCQCIDGRF